MLILELLAMVFSCRTHVLLLLGEVTLVTLLSLAGPTLVVPVTCRKLPTLTVLSSP